MKIVTLNNLKEVLDLMKPIFGAKYLANKHRDALNTYILNINYDALDHDASLSILGTGELGTIILGKNS